MTGADIEELHGEDGQQESHEQLELQERNPLFIELNSKSQQQSTVMLFHAIERMLSSVE